jgi:hypothetical protein
MPLRDYFQSMQLNPVIDAIIDVFNPIRIDYINQQTTGIAYNTTELHQNNSVDVIFIPLFVTFFNGEGAARQPSFQDTLGNNLFSPFTIGALTGFVLNNTLQPFYFNRLRTSLAGGSVAGGATVITFLGYKLIK